MSGERYIFDQPVGIHGYKSHELMAEGAIKSLIQYEDELDKGADPLEELVYMGVARDKPDEFRLSSLVESPAARMGYGLALATPNQSDRANMGGILFRVDRDNGPSVAEVKPLIVARPETYAGNQDYQAQIEELIFSFDRGELESIMRMVNKMRDSLELARKLRTAEIDEEVLDRISVPARMRKDAETKRTKQTLARLSLVEPYVHFALRHHSKSDLNTFFPVEQPMRTSADAAETDSERLHILEWHEFMLAARDLIDREADPRRQIAHVNVQYEISGKLYYVKLATERSRLFGVQVLCDNSGAWESQRFDLDQPDDDRNIISHIWNKDDILACLLQGEIIDDESYEYNRLMGEDSIKAAFDNSAAIIRIDEIKKRPAA
jgi:hypothetical protein